MAPDDNDADADGEREMTPRDALALGFLLTQLILPLSAQDPNAE